MGQAEWQEATRDLPLNGGGRSLISPESGRCDLAIRQVATYRLTAVKYIPAG